MINKFLTNVERCDIIKIKSTATYAIYFDNINYVFVILLSIQIGVKAERRECDIRKAVTHLP